MLSVLNSEFQANLNIFYVIDIKKHRLQYLYFTVPARLAEGVTVGKILDEVHEHTDPQVLRRIDLLQRKDLHNIRRDYNLLGDRNSYTPGKLFEKLETQLECCSSDDSMDSPDREEDCQIKSMLKSMLALSEKSVLDKYNQEILRIILKQGMDVLTDNVSKTDQSTVSEAVGTQNTIPQKRIPLTRTVSKNENSDLTILGT